MLRYNGEVRCEDCRNLEDGCCPLAEAFLARAGYPVVAVRPGRLADASACPDFGFREPWEQPGPNAARAWRCAAPAADEPGG